VSTAFDLLISARHHLSRISVAAAVAHLIRESGYAYDPTVTLPQ